MSGTQSHWEKFNRCSIPAEDLKKILEKVDDNKKDEKDEK